MKAYKLHGLRLLEISRDGEPLSTDRDAVNLVGLAWEHGAGLVVIPVEALAEDFFRLSTRVAGQILHRLLLYKLQVAIVGDVSKHIAESAAFRDFVVESNRGDQVWFVSSVGELEGKLAKIPY